MESSRSRDASRASPGELERVALRPDVNVLSVDLEAWPGTTSVEETEYLLELLYRKRSRATFFVLGSVACRQPALVRRIAAEGHEIGSHGWDHEPLHRKTPERLREDLARAVETLSGLTGRPVAGFRAPHFSITGSTWWALDALAEAGFTYDSSIFPIAGRRYGIPEFPRWPVRITRGDRSIVEVPLSTVRALGTNLPVAGGGYFRLLPYPLIERSVRAVRAEGLPFVVYCHPYEFRREPLVLPPRPGALGGVRVAAREARFNLLRQTMRGKLSRLLDAFRFTSFEDALGQRRRERACARGTT